MAKIHPTAIVDSRAQLAEDVMVGPYAIIGPDVRIGAGSVVHSHCVIQESTVIGAGCAIGPAAYLGQDPQHLEFLGRRDRPQTWLAIGDRTTVRETATIHRSTRAGLENATRIGGDCLIMGGIHIGHDCRLGDRVILANGALMGGHCQLGDRVFMGGGSALHQFVRVGRLAILSGNEPTSRDIPPFAAVRYGGLKGYNAVGCRRAGIARESILAIRGAFQCIHSHRTTNAIVRAIQETVRQVPEVVELLEFIAASKRGIMPSLAFAHYLGDRAGGDDGQD